jgi:hypothetical protein
MFSQLLISGSRVLQKSQSWCLGCIASALEPSKRDQKEEGRPAAEAKKAGKGDAVVATRDTRPWKV